MDDRWKTLIGVTVWGAKPFCELIGCTRGLTKKTLRHALAEMERHGLVPKEVRFGRGARGVRAHAVWRDAQADRVGVMYEWGLPRPHASDRRRTFLIGAGDRRGTFRSTPWRRPTPAGASPSGTAVFRKIQEAQRAQMAAEDGLGTRPLIGLAPAARAQVSTGNIYGKVIDESQAACRTATLSGPLGPDQRTRKESSAERGPRDAQAGGHALGLRGQQSGFAAKVARADAVWNLDGVNITDMTAVGASPSYFDYDAFEEIQITTSGNDIRQSTGGVGLNFVTKRGTNQFHGTIRGYFDARGPGARPTRPTNSRTPRRSSSRTTSSPSRTRRRTTTSSSRTTASTSAARS